MQIKRIIVIADGIDLRKLCGAIITCGVSSQDIHVSRDASQEVAGLNVSPSLPEGKLTVSSDQSRYGDPVDYEDVIDNLVP
ncbi:MAG: hypothetical protein AAB420_03990 [Patescibacteria group bacterium]